MTTPADLRAAAHQELFAEAARKFGEIRFKATGDSMLPSVWPGDLLTVRRQSFSEFRRGQIVLYERGASENADLVAHRIVDFSGDCSGRQLITRGDSLPGALPHEVSRSLKAMADSERQHHPQHWLWLQPRRGERSEPKRRQLVRQ